MPESSQFGCLPHLQSICQQLRSSPSGTENVSKSSILCSQRCYFILPTDCTINRAKGSVIIISWVKSHPNPEGRWRDACMKRIVKNQSTDDLLLLVCLFIFWFDTASFKCHYCSWVRWDFLSQTIVGNHARADKMQRPREFVFMRLFESREVERFSWLINFVRFSKVIHWRENNCNPNRHPLNERIVLHSMRGHKTR